MTAEYIQALGNLLATYNSDLTYIRDFHRYKNSKLSRAEYLKKSTGTFKSFIDDFRVARNIDKTKTGTLLDLATKWIKEKNPDNVDDFAELLKNNGITHGKVMTSLASKILFLNNPWVIFPLDNLAKKAVGLRNNRYVNYFPLVGKFINGKENEINKLLVSVDSHLVIIEEQFEGEINNIKKIRVNRFADKLLWTKGREK